MGEVIELSVMGVTVVFLFLTALVLAIYGTGAFFRVFEERFSDGPPPSQGGGAGARSDRARIAALVGAIQAQRERRLD